MKYILIIGLLVTRVMCFGADINAKSYGAKGDGLQDDSEYLNAAITKAVSLGQNLFIPAGIYKCNQHNSYSKILTLDQPGIKKIKIYGEEGTKITTEQNVGSILYVYDKNVNVIIENIFFENTHGIVMNQTSGIQLLGTGLNSIENFTIQHCRFEGFSSAIVAQGVNGLVIQNNIFESPKGHDNAQDNSQPAVFIWLADNFNGQCFHVKILNNLADGFTGKDISSTGTKRPIDGFICGIVYGILIKGNVTRNLCEEHIFLIQKTTFPDSKDSAIITGNKFYQSLPSGCLKEGLPLISNYGVRADCNNVVITDNDFYDYSLGILLFPIQLNLKQHTCVISGNRFSSAKSKMYHVREAIKIQGTAAKPVEGIIITNNNIQITGIQLKSTRSVIALYDCKNVRIKNNKVNMQNIESNGYSLSWLLTQKCQKLENKDNDVKIK